MGLQVEHTQSGEDQDNTYSISKPNTQFPFSPFHGITNPMFGLYIHIPFCTSKCPYCDFYSTSDSSPQQIGYVELLKKQLQIWRREQPDLPAFDSIFFGGGTPSLMLPDEIATIIDSARELFGIASTAEISMEANPGTVTRESLQGYKAAGINRISFGMQSTDSDSLDLLGRGHSHDQSVAAICTAQDIGFDSVGADMIFALPDQTTEQHLDSLKKLIDLKPDHISIYGLTIEEDTPFAARYPSPELIQNDETYREMFLGSNHLLSEHGFSHYEISNYAKPGKECRHNSIYWQRQPYIGIGPGAHSFLNIDGGIRLAAEPSLDSFRKNLSADENTAKIIETFSKEQAISEAIYLALRTRDGIDIASFVERFGVDPMIEFSATIDKHRSYFDATDNKLTLNLEGWLLYNHIITDFLAP